MNDLDVIRKVIELAFSCGKIINLDEIKTVTKSYDIIENIVKHFYAKQDLDK
jgi:hypothetical protein